MISFKPMEDEDMDFIERVYGSTREKELSTTNWTQEQKRSFVIMQSVAQLSEYRSKYQGATYEVILVKKKPAGRLFLWETDNEIRIVDIALLPEFSGKGIGKKILTGIIEAARKKHKAITLHVLRDNPAIRLYESLGFRTVHDKDDRVFMQCVPV